jgi:protein gp37
MSGATSIEWTDATWNPVRGCTRVSEGCRFCYAERTAARFAGSGPGSGTPFEGFAEMRDDGPHWTGKVELVPGKMEEPLRWKKPQKIFVNSMSDLFHEKLKDSEIADVFGIMCQAERHTFQVLTKRPARMLAWFRDYVGEASPGASPLWPIPNVWLGVSVEDQETADERIPLLLRTPAAVRFVSYEPALGPVDFGRWILGCSHEHSHQSQVCILSARRVSPGLDWIIVGGESGPGARPFDIAWARWTVAACKAAGVPVFVKQLGALPGFTGVKVPLPGPDAEAMFTDSRIPGWTLWQLLDRKGGDWNEWPEDLRVREFPAARA